MKKKNTAQTAPEPHRENGTAEPKNRMPKVDYWKAATTFTANLADLRPVRIDWEPKARILTIDIAGLPRATLTDFEPIPGVTLRAGALAEAERIAAAAAARPDDPVPLAVPVAQILDTIGGTSEERWAEEDQAEYVQRRDRAISEWIKLKGLASEARGEAKMASRITRQNRDLLQEVQSEQLRRPVGEDEYDQRIDEALQRIELLEKEEKGRRLVYLSARHKVDRAFQDIKDIIARHKERDLTNWQHKEPTGNGHVPKPSSNGHSPPAPPAESERPSLESARPLPITHATLLVTLLDQPAPATVRALETEGLFTVQDLLKRSATDYARSAYPGDNCTRVYKLLSAVPFVSSEQALTITETLEANYLIPPDKPGPQRRRP